MIDVVALALFVLAVPGLGYLTWVVWHAWQEDREDRLWLEQYARVLGLPKVRGESREALRMRIRSELHRPMVRVQREVDRALDDGPWTN